MNCAAANSRSVLVRLRVRAERKPTRRSAWVLLETVIATGLLVTGLAVIGAQVQAADRSVKTMQRHVRGMLLAQMKLAELDMGLVELDSVDIVQEEEFGPRYPDFAWRLTTEESAIDDVYVLALEVLYHPNDSVNDYREGSFDFDASETIHRVYAVRPAPQSLNLEEELGLDEEQVDQLSERLVQLGIPGLDAQALDPTILATLDFEDFLEVLPVIAEAMGLDLTSILGALPPGLLDTFNPDDLLQGNEAGGDSGEGGS